MGDRFDGAAVNPTDTGVGSGVRNRGSDAADVALIEGSLVRKDSEQSKRWSGPESFRIVLESAPMNEAELSEYHRRIGLLPEHIRQCADDNVRRRCEA